MKGLKKFIQRLLINSKITLMSCLTKGIRLAPKQFHLPKPSRNSSSDAHVSNRELDSMIISAIPALLGDLRGRALNLLWRGSRDGFDASEFHKRCDGCGNTLTLIKDRGGFIFGGFTPVPWFPPENENEEDENEGDDYEEDSEEKFQFEPVPDPSGESYIFSIASPSALPPRKFPLILEENERAIYYSRQCGPIFGNKDMLIHRECNSLTLNSTRGFGSTYRNTTAMDGQIFFTGTAFFTVAEIEVFQVG
jgi:hypothetical protein